MPPQKPYLTVSPSAMYDKRPFGSEPSYEYDSLLAHNCLSVHPYSPTFDLECGGNRNDSHWMVLCALHVKTQKLWHSMAQHEHGEKPKHTTELHDGPHWHLMLATWFIFFIVASLINILTLNKASIFEIGGGMVLSALCLTCYALVGCSNPGIVRRIEVPPDNTYTYCDHCDSYRPEGALHCLKCRVCIEEYDHHCPWTGKCIGKGNVHFFYIWLLFLVLAFVYEVIEFTMYLLPSETQSIELSNDSLKIETPSITIS
ncbi:putative palmitoyltransferase, DHHC domain-containing protein [Plasmopara halstedii]